MIEQQDPASKYSKGAEERAKRELRDKFNSQNDLFQVHIKIHIMEVLLGLISFESLSDSLQLVLIVD